MLRACFRRRVRNTVAQSRSRAEVCFLGWDFPWGRTVTTTRGQTRSLCDTLPRAPSPRGLCRLLGCHGRARFHESKQSRGSYIIRYSHISTIVMFCRGRKIPFWLVTDWKLIVAPPIPKFTSAHLTLLCGRSNVFNHRSALSSVPGMSPFSSFFSLWPNSCSLWILLTGQMAVLSSVHCGTFPSYLWLRANSKDLEGITNVFMFYTPDNYWIFHVTVVILSPEAVFIPLQFLREVISLISALWPRLFLETAIDADLFAVNVNSLSTASWMETIC